MHHRYSTNAYLHIRVCGDGFIPQIFVDDPQSACVADVAGLLPKGTQETGKSDCDGHRSTVDEHRNITRSKARCNPCFMWVVECLFAEPGPVTNDIEQFLESSRNCSGVSWEDYVRGAITLTHMKLNWLDAQKASDGCQSGSHILPVSTKWRFWNTALLWLTDNINFERQEEAKSNFNKDKDRIPTARTHIRPLDPSFAIK